MAARARLRLVLPPARGAAPLRAPRRRRGGAAAVGGGGQQPPPAVGARRGGWRGGGRRCRGRRGHQVGRPHRRLQRLLQLPPPGGCLPCLPDHEEGRAQGREHHRLHVR
ncbi:hypothetical protein EE612_003477 [Oryza sativa]|nr:hypothetical protein EE612_003477 [Oryza sativa]